MPALQSSRLRKLASRLVAIGQESRELRAVSWLARQFELTHHKVGGKAMASRSHNRSNQVRVSHPRRHSRKRLLIEMVDTTFIIQFKAPDLGAQPVIAARAEVRGEHLLLLNSNGQLAAAFMLENVMSWSEVSSEAI